MYFGDGRILVLIMIKRLNKMFTRPKTPTTLLFLHIKVWCRFDFRFEMSCDTFNLEVHPF